MKCDCSLDPDAEGPAFLREDYPLARKEHTCCECGGTIQPGEEYERAALVMQSRWSTYVTCMSCVRIRREYCPGGWVYGSLRETLDECLEVEL